MILDEMEYHKLEYPLVKITKHECQPWVQLTACRTVWIGVTECCIVRHGSFRDLTSKTLNRFDRSEKYGPTIEKGSDDYRRRQAIACVAISKAQGC
jgi:PP-loop superfamily ATP-utilizing enzyme